MFKVFHVNKKSPRAVTPEEMIILALANFLEQNHEENATPAENDAAHIALALALRESVRKYPYSRSSGNLLAEAEKHILKNQQETNDTAIEQKWEALKETLKRSKTTNQSMLKT